jgi:hypothetical protein
MEGFDMRTLEGYRAGGAVLPSSDQHVGRIIVDSHTLHLREEPRDNIVYNDDGYVYSSGNTYAPHTLLVILESPHRFEYDASGHPVALVMGKTGCLFFRLFEDALRSSVMRIKEGTYDVVLANAVQYQTSCGLSPMDRTLRDKNWFSIYDDHGGEENLRQRIFALKPWYTVNCATGGRNPSGIRARVSKSLDAFGLIKGKHYTEGTHPASWEYARGPSSKLIE